MKTVTPTAKDNRNRLPMKRALSCLVVPARRVCAETNKQRNTRKHKGPVMNQPTPVIAGPAFRLAAVPILLAFLAAVSAVRGAEPPPPGHQPRQYVGYWNDGSGVFQGCTPVASWNEWEFTTGEIEVQGKKTNVERPVKENRKNIVWKVPHYNWCNGGVIVAGGKVFGLSDRGGMGYFGEQVADFVGAKLSCFAPADGKLLWQTDLDHWDLVPQGAELREKLKEFNRRIVPIFNAWAPIGRACRAGYMDEAVFAKLAPPFQALAPKFPKTWADCQKEDSKFFNSDYPFFKVFTMLERYFPDVLKLILELRANGQYFQDPWTFAFDYLGLNMQTPVSDGKHVYVQTSFGAVFCVDLEGRVVWKQWNPAAITRGAAIPSPILCGDLLIVTRGTKPVPGGPGGGRRTPEPIECVALNKRDGKKVWASPTNDTGHYRAAPIAMSLPLKGDPARRLEVIIFHNGDVVRVRDGKTVANKVAMSGHARPWAVWKDVLVLTNRRQDGGHDVSESSNPRPGGTLAIKLRAVSEDEVSSEVLWHDAKGKFRDCPVVRDGLVYMVGDREFQIRDALTGAMVDKKPYPRGSDTFHMHILAGNQVIGLNPSGRSLVVSLSSDGRRIEAIGVNRLGTASGRGGGPPTPFDEMFNYGSQLFASGNRIFIRSNRDLYCIGDPAQPLRLSPEHQ
jgi:outer membrane protein assembly factor BamB